jgi:hypothetical protein
MQNALIPRSQQVLADQAVWAVCGRVAGVINMESTKKQTMTVEVMPLVGGHLQLPRVRYQGPIFPHGDRTRYQFYDRELQRKRRKK